MEKSSIGKFISVLRKANGLTQQQLADKCNVSNKTVSKWETEETLPDIDLLPILAEIFEVSCDEILRGRRDSGLKANYDRENIEPAEKRLLRLASRVNTHMKIMSIISMALAGLTIALFVILMVAYLKLAAFITAIILAAAAIILQTVNIVLVLQKMNFVSDEFSSLINKDKIINKCKRALYDYSFIAFSACFLMIIIFIAAIAKLY